MGKRQKGKWEQKSGRLTRERESEITLKEREIK